MRREFHFKLRSWLWSFQLSRSWEGWGHGDGDRDVNDLVAFCVIRSPRALAFKFVLWRLLVLVGRAR